MGDYESTDRIVFVAGGSTRQRSVRNGLIAAKSFHPSHTIIHDAARPYCSVSLIERVINELERGSLSAIPIIKSVDSVRVGGKMVDRDSISMVQTPQGFVFDTIYRLHEKYDGADMSDDASLFDLENMKVSFVEGEPTNKKVTYREDVITDAVRVGFGFDSHNLSKNPKRILKLCGVSIPDAPGLDGVSDADVAIHSLIDAILGATGRGSIGEIFPVDDPASKNADSMVFLRKVLSETFRIVNVDITIICDKPNISKYSYQMAKNISDCLGIDSSRINIKGKTTEGSSIVGIAAFATILISLI